MKNDLELLCPFMDYKDSSNGSRWKGSSTKEGATCKGVAKSRKRNRVSKKQRKINRR